MKTTEYDHVPVMMEEALDGLAIKPEGYYVDATYGRGGHAARILQGLNNSGHLWVMDRDCQAIELARTRYAGESRVSVIKGNYADMDHCASIFRGVDGILMDIGVSSPQLDDGARGFSFTKDAPLDMRMDQSQGQTAADFLSVASAEEIADVLWNYGEERHSHRIARAIVSARNDQPIERTLELADLVSATLGYREKGKHPATRTFQALRIYVNDELQGLKQGLEAALACLNEKGRLVVISFHSLEDRIVKHFISSQLGKAPPQPRHLPPLPARPALLKKIGKAKFANRNELQANPRARSAVLRVAERTGVAA